VAKSIFFFKEEKLYKLIGKYILKFEKPLIKWAVNGINVIK